MKVCTKCAIPKTLTDFYKDRTKRDGLSCRCKSCIKTFNKEHILTLARKRHHEDPRSQILRSASCRAKAKNIPFDLTEEDIVVPRLCPVLGIPLFVSTGRQSDNSPSIDRIVPEVGYVRGNVRIVSLRCNRIKNDATAADLEAILSYVRENTR